MRRSFKMSHHIELSYLTLPQVTPGSSLPTLCLTAIKAFSLAADARYRNWPQTRGIRICACPCATWSFRPAMPDDHQIASAGRKN